MKVTDSQEATLESIRNSWDDSVVTLPCKIIFFQIARLFDLDISATGTAPGKIQIVSPNSKGRKWTVGDIMLINVLTVLRSNNNLH